jgi:hypothetical protein
MSIENVNVHGAVFDIVAIHTSHQATYHGKLAIRIRFISLQARYVSPITWRQLGVQSSLKFPPRECGKGAATDQHETGCPCRMACGVRKREHCSPGVANENWMNVPRYSSHPIFGSIDIEARAFIPDLTAS